jgi:general secretion pathway protein G
MTRTSAFFRRTRTHFSGRARASSRGFTLLELLVVLAIVAAVSAVIGPVTWRAVENAERRGARADVHAALAAIPLTAFRQGRPLHIDASGLSRLGPELPADCSLALPDPPLIYAANGMAAGGRVLLTCGGQTSTFEVAPVTGEVRLIREDIP